MAIQRGGILWLAGGLVAVLAAGLLIKQPSGDALVDSTEAPSPVRPPGDPSANRPAKPPRQPSLPTLRNLPALPAPENPPHAPGSPAQRDWIEKRAGELESLAWNHDPESLGKILTELRNPLPEIRAVALEATKAFGSRDAVPYLEAISRDTADPLEQKEITRLIEYLNLPTLLEQTDSNENE